ncbi:MAG: cytochrome c oxidase subunit 3 [Myxococcota bacterium]
MNEISEEAAHDPTGGPHGHLRLGLFLFLVSVTVLFISALIACGVTWSTQSNWVSIPVTRAVWSATVVAILLSGVMHVSQRSFSRNNLDRGSLTLQAAAGLAVLFCVNQGLAWHGLATQGDAHHTLHAATFYTLTGLHAAHVLGGVVPLAVAVMKARRGEYSSSRYEPVRLLRLYWDYLLVVWFVLVGALYIMA